jgi:reductive dehalogenase
LALLLFWVHVESRRERERTAARRSLLLVPLVLLPYLILAWTGLPGREIAGAGLLIVTLGGAAVLLIPTGRVGAAADPVPASRLDERTIMFSRAVLEPGTDRFEDYYRQFPQHRVPDDRFRSLPGLMSPASRQYEPLSFAAAAASFDVVEELADLVSGPPAKERHRPEPDQVTRFVKGWAEKLGAVDCGVTELREYHLYSLKGRGPAYGQPIDLHEPGGHRFAIALTVEMDHANLGTAPAGPTLMESAQQYLEAGAIAVQIAAFIRRLGFAAEAHIDAHYKVICPLVARDAGLGEIGRMGLLMTPPLGPRVRIAVVTTDLPLETDTRRPDPTVNHFCGICRKCAEICPPRAIPAGQPEIIDGALRWQIDQEACFTYWCTAGTDCGQCMKVCPYSHPDSPLHNLVRWGLRRSVIFRHFALRMDDLLYGRKPGPLPHPSWLPEPNHAKARDPRGFDDLRGNC